jgi:2-polyprenyl-3-methyl-5-hydroxy-6-metoxy-1,4-benzoquinol methylase
VSILFKKAVDFGVREYRKVYRDFAVSSHAKSNWMKDIAYCQKEIAELQPHPKYLADYRDQEVYYWLQIPNWIRKESSKNKVKRCLDIGCAYGTLALYCKKLFNCEVYATDYVDTYLSRMLAAKYDFHFEVNNVELDDFPWDKEFDLIIFTEVLEHLNFNPVPTLKKIRQLLSPNGKMYLSTPDASQWGRVLKYYSCLADLPSPQKGAATVDDHVYQYTKEELLEVLNSAGFKVDRLGYSPGYNFRHFNLSLSK